MLRLEVGGVELMDSGVGSLKQHCGICGCLLWHGERCHDNTRACTPQNTVSRLRVSTPSLSLEQPSHASLSSSNPATVSSLSLSTPLSSDCGWIVTDTPSRRAWHAFLPTLLPDDPLRVNIPEAASRYPHSTSYLYINTSRFGQRYILRRHVALHT